MTTYLSARYCCAWCGEPDDPEGELGSLEQDNDGDMAHPLCWRVRSWLPGDDVPAGHKVYDGNAESGPCEPHLVPIDYDDCDRHGRQEVRSHFVAGAAHDPYDGVVLACGCRKVGV